VRTGGETVAPVEVDLVLQRHPAVADAAVAGIPHDDWGEVLAAFVVLKPGAQLDLAAVRPPLRGSTRATQAAAAAVRGRGKSREPGQPGRCSGGGWWRIAAQQQRG